MGRGKTNKVGNSNSASNESKFKLGDEIGNETIIAVGNNGIFQLRPTKDVDEDAFSGGGDSYNDRFLDADQLLELQRRDTLRTTFTGEPAGAAAAEGEARRRQAQSTTASTVFARSITNNQLSKFSTGDAIELSDSGSTKPTRYVKKSDGSWEYRPSRSNFTETWTQERMKRELGQFSQSTQVRIVRRRKK